MYYTVNFSEIEKEQEKCQIFTFGITNSNGLTCWESLSNLMRDIPYSTASSTASKIGIAFATSGPSKPLHFWVVAKSNSPSTHYPRASGMRYTRTSRIRFRLNPCFNDLIYNYKVGPVVYPPLDFCRETIYLTVDIILGTLLSN